MSGTETPGLSSRRPRLSMRTDPMSPSPVILAAGFEETVTVNMITYVAGWFGYDGEECILKALEDREIEMYKPSPSGNRGDDLYRLTVKGRNEADQHIFEVLQKGREVKWRGHEEDREGNPCPEAAAGSSRGDGPLADTAASS